MSVKHIIRDYKGKLVEVELTPRKAIRSFCRECMCFQDKEIQGCTAVNCPLFPFRLSDAHSMGKEQREKMRELIKTAIKR